jgi:hypothetical protein
MRPNENGVEVEADLLYKERKNVSNTSDGAARLIQG